MVQETTELPKIRTNQLREQYNLNKIIQKVFQMKQKIDTNEAKSWPFCNVQIGVKNNQTTTKRTKLYMKHHNYTIKLQNQTKNTNKLQKTKILH